MLIKNYMFILAIISNFGIISDISFFRILGTVLLLFVIPGNYIYRILGINRRIKFEKIVYIISLGLFSAMFIPLILIILSHLFGVASPLSVLPIVTIYNVFFLICETILYKMNSSTSYALSLNKKAYPRFNTSLGLISLALIILGTISLNNNGTNIISVIGLSLIAVNFITLIQRAEKSTSNEIMTNLYLISVSILLSVSMRGAYLSGSDVKLEYYTYKLTQQSGNWVYDNFINPYNACLSITILPTLLNLFINNNDTYIFKFYLQIFIALIPTLVYSISRDYSSKKNSVIASLIFISFPFFLNDITSYIRQEVALLFFALLVKTLTDYKTSPKINSILFVIFGVSLVVSHYTTTYLALFVIVTTFILGLILINPNIQGTKWFYSVNPISMAIVVIFALMWNTIFTNSITGLMNFTNKIEKNIGTFATNENKSDDVKYSLVSKPNYESDKERLTKYIEDSKNKTIGVDTTAYYENKEYQRYKLSSTKQDMLPTTNLGKVIEKKNINLFALNYYIRQVTARTIQVFVLIGLIVMLREYKRGSTNSRLLNILSVLCVFTTTATLVIPFISTDYSIVRVFQQMLIVLCIPATIGVKSIFNKLFREYADFATSVIIALMFLELSGVVPQMIGNYYPQLNLNNMGYQFDSYYTHKSEIYSLKWLESNISNEKQILSDFNGVNKIQGYTKLRATNQIIPQLIRKDSAVYLTKAVANTKTMAIYHNGNQLFIKYPINFLEDNKSLVYNNRGSLVYE